jgi:hypothetical protein
MLGHLGQVDPAAGEGVQRPVVGERVDPPALLVGQVGQRGPVGDAHQLQDPEHQVGVYMDKVKRELGRSPGAL